MARVRHIEPLVELRRRAEGGEEGGVLKNRDMVAAFDERVKHFINT